MHLGSIHYNVSGDGEGIGAIMDEVCVWIKMRASQMPQDIRNAELFWPDF